MQHCNYFGLLISLAMIKPCAASEKRFAVLADAGKRTETFESVRRSLKRMATMNLILPGDNLYSESYESVWSSWPEEGFHFEVTAIGNHNGGYEKEVAFFNKPAEFYSKIYDDRARFIVLNSDNPATVNLQQRFLEKELREAREPFVFLVYHHPSYNLSHFHNWTEKRSFQLMLRPLLTKYRSKLTGLLVGHDHLALLAEFDDLPVIVSGAVHEARRDIPINNIQDGVKVATRWFFDGEAYWARLSIPDKGSFARVEFIRANDDAIRCTATIETGQGMRLSSDCGNSFNVASVIRALLKI